MTCPVQKFGRARTNLGRAAGRDFRLPIEDRILDDGGVHPRHYEYI